MENLTPEEEAKKLREEIEYHSNLYYNEDSPKISDYEYDMLMQRLRTIERENPNLQTKDSPTQHVGGAAKREAGVLVRHNNPMLSLQDVFNKEDVYAFVNEMKQKLENPEFVVEYKIDGLSLSLRYENGRLLMAETRGDGIEFGEDVTENSYFIKDIKRELKNAPEYLEIRGEVYMKNEDFERTNERQELLGKKTFKNPRNCAAGTLRQLDPAVVKERGLSMFVFNLQESRGREFKTHTECYSYLKEEGIPVIEDYRLCHTADEVWEEIERIGENRGNLLYDIDGAVVKINKYSDREYLGQTAKVPRWAIAYKYPPEEKVARIEDISLSVGRTGRINPTAIFTPVRLCGTTVSRATLHNQDFIDELDIGIGDFVYVYKSGEIIPKIKSVLKEKREGDIKAFKIPHECPVCHSPLVREENTSDIRCVNYSCPAQLTRHLIHFVSREAMDIKGFGEVYMEELKRHGYLHDIADIYTLKDKRDELIEKGIIGKEKNTDKLLTEIERSKENDAASLLTGLGILNVGKSAAKSLISHFGSIENIMNAEISDLTEVNDIGEVSASCIKTFFSDEKNVILLNRLKEYGVNTKGKEIKPEGSVFSGLTFVITGTLPTMKREEAAALIEKNGGKVTGSVSKKTDYLLLGENAGSKLDKARNLGVKIVSEDELKELISGSIRD